MRAAVVEAFGPFDRIKVKQIEAPSPGAGEILIRVSVAGVNFADGGMVSGRAARKQPPFVPGVEAAGIVEAVGAGVSGRSVGDRVVYWDPMPRAFAELVSRPRVARVGNLRWRARRGCGRPDGAGNDRALPGHGLVQARTGPHLSDPRGGGRRRPAPGADRGAARGASDRGRRRRTQGEDREGARGGRGHRPPEAAIPPKRCAMPPPDRVRMWCTTAWVRPRSKRRSDRRASAARACSTAQRRAR